MKDDPFGAVLGAADETRTLPTYFFNNALRPGPRHLVLQRTLRGAGFFQNGRERRLVPAGYCMLFEHGEATQYGYPPDATEPYLLRFVSMTDKPCVRTYFDAIRRDFGSVVSMPDHAEVTVLYDEVFDLSEKRRFRDRFEESELLQRVLIALYREQVKGTQATDPIEFGYHYIRSHFRSPINLKQVAQKCGISREHFIREFSARYPRPPGALLRDLRMQHADAMLASTERTLEEIALASGFTSGNAFCRAYTVHFGRTPRRRSRRGRG